MQTVSVTIDRFVEDKFEHFLNEYGYEFSKHYDEEQQALRLQSESDADANEVSFVLTSEEEFDLIELGMLNECARQIQHLENLDLENFKNLFDNSQSPHIRDEGLLNAEAGRFSN